MAGSHIMTCIRSPAWGNILIFHAVNHAVLLIWKKKKTKKQPPTPQRGKENSKTSRKNYEHLAAFKRLQQTLREVAKIIVLIN